MKKILLIDDDQDLCELTKKVLVGSGYSVSAFCDAQAGIANARQNKPNLILMDILMPGASGPEIVSSLKTDAQLKDIPIVFLTGLITGRDEDLQNEGVSVGGIKYQTLGKPYEIERLLEVVKRTAK